MTEGLVTVRLPVSAVVERRPSSNPWTPWTWRAVGIVPRVEAAPWTVLREAGGATAFLAGAAEIELHSSDTPNYLSNLQADPPLAWIVLRPSLSGPHPYELFTVTVDPGEAHLFADSGQDILESLPMPAEIREDLAAFCAAHHRDRVFIKRKRDRADPEARGRRPR